MFRVDLQLQHLLKLGFQWQLASSTMADSYTISCLAKENDLSFCLTASRAVTSSFPNNI